MLVLTNHFIILRILHRLSLFVVQTSTLYACRFLTKGGAMILATWLSQAAVEEQTSVLLVILKVFAALNLVRPLSDSRALGLVLRILIITCCTGALSFAST